MYTSTTIRGESTGKRLDIKALVGSGDRIGRVVLPLAVAGVAFNVARPALFRLGASDAFQIASAVMLAAGVIVWLWSVVLILTRVPKHALITSGPFALMKHPLYTGVSLLLLPSLGFLLDTWLGLALGLVIYTASRRYAPAEEQALADEFGPEWDAYAASVKLPWL